jgi:hypothetical protein
MESQLYPVLSRNLQLDFFRGIALIIIFINHMPDNPWFWYTPSRFGLSDAAEMFVFLSGFASAIAYGRSFDRAGLWLGSVRVLHRCGQIYAAHVASFLLMAVICVLGNRWTLGADYIQRLNIAYFFDNTQQAVIDIFSLAYVPNYFDILPMYLVLILWMPLVWALSRLHIVLALSFSVLIYYAAWQYGWELTADPTTGRPWYFNPFNWQLMFFTGFALGEGWIRVPDKHRGLMLICAIIVSVSIPLGHEATYGQMAFWGELRARLEPFLDKSHLGLLRWVHLLALAYLMNQLFKWKPQWLTMGLPVWIIRMGQQSLPIFLCCMSLSYVGGIALDWLGRDATSIAMINLAGIGLMLATAKVLAWLDRKPWKLPADQYNQKQASTLDASADLRNIPYVWGKQALLLPFLICLAVFPMLLLQTTNSRGLSSPEIMVQAPPSDDFQKVNIVIPKINPEAALENQQQL